jgi:hypothetical protein
MFPSSCEGVGVTYSVGFLRKSQHHSLVSANGPNIVGITHPPHLRTEIDQLTKHCVLYNTT